MCHNCDVKSSPLASQQGCWGKGQSVGAGRIIVKTGPSKRNTVEIGKNEVSQYVGGGSQSSNPVDDRLWGRKFIKGAMFDNKATNQVKKVVRSLEIASWAEADRRKGSRFHGICRGIILLGLTISSKRCPAMGLKQELMVKDEFVGAVVGKFHLSLENC
jgi:hypothetical protein